MHKLLELWELDDSALSNHSLQVSNSLSVNKHLSLYNEKQEESPHHVDSLRDCCDDTKTSRGPEIVWPESSTVESPDVLFCEKCRYANQQYANWCVECGTALLGTKIEVQSGDDLADLNLEVSTESLPPFFDGMADQNSTSDIEFNSLKLSNRHTCTYNEQTLNDQDSSNYRVPVHTNLYRDDLVDSKRTGSIPKSPKRSHASPVMTKTHPNNRTKKFRNTIVNKNTTTSQLVTRKEYQRHWNTSSTYMWRKPSSIQKSASCLVNDAHQNNWTQLSELYAGYESHTSNSILSKHQVPVLDLDAIGEGSMTSSSVCTSIISSSSINEVWTLYVCVGGGGEGREGKGVDTKLQCVMDKLHTTDVITHTRGVYLHNHRVYV